MRREKCRLHILYKMFYVQNFPSKKFIETAEIGKWHNYFSFGEYCNLML